MLQLDGSAGEGGGQVLRTALGLALVTGRPFFIDHIRARRQKPGLRHQHLAAVRAAAAIGGAELAGAELGSGRLVFAPGAVRPGSYRFAIGTAGSCILVLQTVLPALLVAAGPSTIVLEGGTHNPMAPPFEFLERTYLPLICRMGARVTARLERPGFFPAGGGRLQVTIEPGERLRPLELTERTNSCLSARALCALLPDHIGRRELAVVACELAIGPERLEQVRIEGSGPGNVLTIFVQSDQLTETITGFGRKNVRAEKVAMEAVEEAKDYLQSGAPVGRHLADQLVLAMALAGTGTFRTSRPSSHTLTNIAVIRQFLEVDIVLSELAGNLWQVEVH